jgi:acyl carrier protein phosphodiesterase
VNYLAHLYLAGDDPDALVGNLMGDFVKGPIPDSLPCKVAAGVRLHRRIDSYTDRHPCFRASRRRLSPPLRRYGGIIVDVIYDHLLAGSWDAHHSEPLPVFAARVYRILDDSLPDLPSAMQRRVRGMIDSRLLEAYENEATVSAALDSIGQRLRRPIGLGAASHDLATDRPGFQADFDAFFPSLKAFVEGERTP